MRTLQAARQRKGCSLLLYFKFRSRPLPPLLSSGRPTLSFSCWETTEAWWHWVGWHYGTSFPQGSSERNRHECWRLCSRYTSRPTQKRTKSNSLSTSSSSSVLARRNRHANTVSPIPPPMRMLPPSIEMISLSITHCSAEWSARTKASTVTKNCYGETMPMSRIAYLGKYLEQMRPVDEVLKTCIVHQCRHIFLT